MAAAYVKKTTGRNVETPRAVVGPSTFPGTNRNAFSAKMLFTNPFELGPETEMSPSGENGFSPSRHAGDGRSHRQGPRPVEAFVFDHPDTTLRRLGVIRQKGVVGNAAVRYHPGRGWVEEATGRAVNVAGGGGGSAAEGRRNSAAPLVVDATPRTRDGTGAAPAPDVETDEGGAAQPSKKAPAEVTERVDTAPKGVIWVIGPAQFRSPPKRTLAPAVDPREVDTMIRFRQQQSDAERTALLPVLMKVQPLIHKDMGSDQHAQTIANMGDADADAAVLTEAEVEKFVRQYLYRSIPAAAQQFGAVVVTSDVDEIHRSLSDGLRVVNDAHDVEAVLVCSQRAADASLLDTTAFTHVVGLTAAWIPSHASN